MSHKVPALMLIALSIVFMTACGSGYKTKGSSSNSNSPDGLETRAWETAALAKTTDPSLETFFDGAAAYAVFPEIAKGGAGIGAAHGEGVLIQDGKIIGYTTVSQGTIGFQLGGQVYSQFIFFEKPFNVDDFKSGNFEFSAQATAVALDKGAGANADYSSGIAIFTMDEQGLMYEASVGGSKFSYTPK